MELSEMEKQGVTCNTSLTSKMTFERHLNDQCPPENFNFINSGITEDWIERIKKRYGRWLRYHRPIEFKELYSAWLEEKRKI